MDKLQSLIKTDSQLPQHIQAFGELPIASKCNVILLTGLTGNFGPYLLRKLLKKENLKIYCLVRKTSLKLAQDILDGIKSYADNQNRVILVAGDLRFEKLGLDLQEYEELSQEVDAIVHSAVKSHHVEMYQKWENKNTDLRTVNVLGTLKIMEFATIGKMKRIFYASSILGCNRVSLAEESLSEELIEEDNYGDGLAMGYAVSKFVGDKLMSEAIRRGIPCLVCRFPLIINDNLTEIADFQKNHAFSIILSFKETGMRSDYPSGFTCAPAEQCANISMDLFFNDEVSSGIYNLMNPHSLDMDETAEELSKVFGIPPWKKVEFSEYSQALQVQGEKSALYPFRMIYFDKDAEQILAEFNLVLKLCLSKQGSQFLQNISSKFRKYVPNVDELIPSPQELIIQMLSKAREIELF